MSEIPTVTDGRLSEVLAIAAKALIAAGVRAENVGGNYVRPESALYMFYWHRRLKNNREERERVRVHLTEYINGSAADARRAARLFLAREELAPTAVEFVEKLLVPLCTIDLVVLRAEQDDGLGRDILICERAFYPLGPALPGGFIREDDEHNGLDVPAPFFAALRVAAEKALGVSASAARYERETRTDGRDAFIVRGEHELPAVRIFAEDETGYRFRENLRNVIRPSDPRHLVDTTGFRCELIGEPRAGMRWRSRAEILSCDEHAGGFAFGHHREIVAFISAQTSVEKQRAMKERDFIRGIIKNPKGEYLRLRARFQGKMPRTVSFPELFPVVDRFMAELFRPEINAVCEEVPLFTGLRDRAVIGLRHVALVNRVVCPYVPTLRAIAEARAFFDLVARHRRGFYAAMPTDRIVEHDPKTMPCALYHQYRYRYRFNELMEMVPDEIVVPTFESLSATDLLRVRGVPIRFTGLAPNFLYVDEYEQSPDEFGGHDENHAWRMVMEDLAALEERGWTRDQLVDESMEFSLWYLDQIRIRPTDTEEQRELKKLKKIILFEIVHEDARPFLRDVICRYVQLKEGGSVRFEVPRVDPRTGYMDVVDTVDTGISTLAYVRCKLQHGFYDHVDAQLPQIVDPRYRSAEWIARAAYEMLVELGAEPVAEADLDKNGNVSYEWLLCRTCAVGPDNIHNADDVDAAVAKYGDGAAALNRKRYQA